MTGMKDIQGRTLYTRTPNEYWEFSASSLSGGQNTVSRTTNFSPPSPSASMAIAPVERESHSAPVVNVYLDLEGEVKLPLHEYIVGVQNRAERAGDSTLSGILAGSY